MSNENDDAIWGHYNLFNCRHKDYGKSISNHRLPDGYKKMWLFSRSSFVLFITRPHECHTCSVFRDTLTFFWVVTNKKNGCYSAWVRSKRIEKETNGCKVAKNHHKVQFRRRGGAPEIIYDRGTQRRLFIFLSLSPRWARFYMTRTRNVGNLLLIKLYLRLINRMRGSNLANTMYLWCCGFARIRRRRS
jgi:hypothetical protein